MYVEHEEHGDPEYYVLTLYTLEHAAQGVQYEQELQQEVLDTHCCIMQKTCIYGYASF